MYLPSAERKKAQTVKQTRKQQQELADYRNTERGMHEKNSKGIYYTNGNYEAFARPEKPEGIENKSAYIVGSGLGALAAACFLVRDAQMPGKNIHILAVADLVDLQIILMRGSIADFFIRFVVKISFKMEIWRSGRQ